MEPAALGRCRTVAHLLDDAIRIPGTPVRIGLDSIVGLLPGAGDLLTGLLSLYIVVEGIRLGVPARTVVVMLLNIALDVGIGSIPLVGDIFDAFWKANIRNVRLIERHLGA